MKSKKVGLYVPGWSNNQIFDAKHPANIDNWLMPFIRLRESLALHGFDLLTIDLIDNPDLLISFTKHYKKDFNQQYFFLSENEYIIKYDMNSLSKKYKKIFTWDDRLVDGVKFIKYYYPQYYSETVFNEFSNRKTLLTLISNNKFLNLYSDNDMYAERYRIIKFFEDNGKSFKLFGSGWDYPFGINGLSDRVLRKIFPNYNKVQLKNYHGIIDSKYKAYTDSKFSICFENVSDIPGYVTEKIFDSMFAGCIPVYCGASNISDYVPNNCWINYNDFISISDLYNFLLSFNESDYKNYQINIKSFLSKWQFNKFSTESFCSNIINEIIKK